MGKQLHKPCEFCFLEKFNFEPNVRIEDEDVDTNEITVEYQHKIHLLFVLKDVDGKTVFPNHVKRQLIIKVTNEPLTFREGLDLIDDTTVRDIVISEVCKIKKDYADFDFTL